MVRALQNVPLWQLQSPRAGPGEKSAEPGENATFYVSESETVLGVELESDAETVTDHEFTVEPGWSPAAAAAADGDAVMVMAEATDDDSEGSEASSMYSTYHCSRWTNGPNAVEVPHQELWMCMQCNRHHILLMQAGWTCFCGEDGAILVKDLGKYWKYPRSRSGD